jgi:SAM-dependent methyltransferase
MDEMDEIQRLLPFTAHKIEIRDGVWTTPNDGDDPLIALTTKVVMERCAGSLSGRRVLDLGCLEGGYSVAFAKLGAQEVVGVEVRELSYERCQLLKRCLRLDNVRFIKEDVKEIDPKVLGCFDIVFAQGILYHMDDPFSFLTNVSRLTSGFALIDTHIARRDSWAHGCSAVLTKKTFGSKVYDGRTFYEYPPGLSMEEIDKLLWASHGNPASFWLTEESLVAMLSEVGFTYISKVYVPHGYRCQEGCKDECRIVLVAKKSWG